MPVRRPILDDDIAALLERARLGIARRLLQAREDAGLSQADVAAAFNRAPQWISKIEVGDITPRADHLVAICSVLDADPGWVLAGDASGVSAFIGRLRSLESRLDERGRQMVLGAAQAAAVPELRAGEDRADADAAAIAEAQAESVRLSETGERDRDAGDQPRKRRRGHGG